MSVTASIDELREAAELVAFEADYDATEYSNEDHDDPELKESIRARIQVSKFASMLLNADPIDEQWLRETWGFRDYGPYRIANLDSRGPLITYWLDQINEGESRLSLSDSRLSVDRGQFTALMFSLGQHPI